MTITTAYQPVFVGSTANDGTGDDLRSAFEKVNSAFGYMGNNVINAVNIDASGTVQAGTVQASLVEGNVSASTLTVTGNLTASFAEFNGNVIFDGIYIPTASNSSGKLGQFAFDGGNIYICVADDTWKRAALSTF